MSFDSAKVMNIAAGRKARSGPPGTREPGIAGHRADPAGAASFSLSCIDRFPGPAMVVFGAEWRAWGNVHAEPLLNALADRDVNLTSLVTRCLAGGAPQIQKIALSGPTGNRHLDLHALPVILDEPAARAVSPEGAEAAAAAGAGFAAVMLFARETTLEHNLTGALVDSRQMFKDLVSCSDDFAWETDIHGVFRYVSAEGAFGYGAHELTGRNSRDLLDDSDGDSDAAPNPFMARERVDGMILALRRNGGGVALVKVTALPHLGPRGDWLGARGMCRDITASKLQETGLMKLQARHNLVTQLAALARDSGGPHMLQSAAGIVGQGLAADCLILRRNSGAFLIEGATATPDPELVAALMDRLEGLVGMQRRASASRPVFETVAGVPAVLAVTLNRGLVNGALVVLGPEGCAFGDHEMALLDEAAAQVALLVSEVEREMGQPDLNRTDPLTGLLNARAFIEVVERRIKNQKRSGHPAALLLVEVDDFDAIGERFGAALAERALKELGQILSDHSRAGDVVARIDHKRFALWLEDTDPKGAGHKARLVIRQSQDVHLGRVTGTGAVSASVGGVEVAAELEGFTVEDLIARAGEALREAQNLGWSHCRMYSGLRDAEDADS